MASDVDVVNDALYQIGEGPINNFDDGTLTANRAKAFYSALVDDALRRYHWAFAKFFDDLVQLETGSPTTKWSYAFKLPNDPYCLAVRVVNNDEKLKWEVAGGRILLLNDDEAEIEFTGRVTDPTQWDATFYQAVTLGLTSKFLASIKHDYKGAQAMMGAYAAVFRDATYQSSQETVQQILNNSDALIDVRGD
jgi:hypothetical protein